MADRETPEKRRRGRPPIPDEFKSEAAKKKARQRQKRKNDLVHQQAEKEKAKQRHHLKYIPASDLTDEEWALKKVKREILKDMEKNPEEYEAWVWNLN